MIPQDVQQWIRNEIFDQAPLCISVIDRDFRIIEANQAFAEQYGAWRDSRCYAVYKGLGEPCAHCAAAKTFSDGIVRVREEKGVVRNGQQTYYIVHIVPVVQEDGSIPYLIEMSTDITEIKLLEREKLEAERLAAVGQTVAGLAHGIKNIIMGLEGGMYVVNSGLKRNDNARISQGWAMLEENIERISAFAKEFLAFARGRTPQVKLADPNEIAEKMISLFRDKAALSGIVLKANLQSSIAPAPMDEEGIHTCLANLISNAMDACEMSEKQERHVTLSTRDEDGILAFEVSDDGGGMEYDIKQKVFTTFFSTKGAGQGTGLGLLTTRKIVQEHGGEVSFESTEGVGSVFRLRFPRRRLPPLTEEEPD